jgi:3-phosphoshikimate 1-carboxyvinyltransferase
MQIIIQPSILKGTVQSPASKSSMQRACAASLLSAGESIILNPGRSNDDKAALAVIEALGCHLSDLPDGSIHLVSEGVNPQTEVLNCGESGLGIRMFAPIIALSDKRITINGEGSLLARPMDFFDEVLPRLGVEVRSNRGKLPLIVQGPLQPKNITIDGSLSSQFLTGLLMAFAAAGASEVTITVKGLKSKPYIDLTLKVMADFGMAVPEHANYEAFHFPRSRPAVSTMRDKVTYRVEGDWSGGAFLLVAGVIAGPLSVVGLDLLSTQADKAILQALTSCGARMEVSANRIEIGPLSGPSGLGLRSFEFDASECPDLFPPLVALASFCQGISKIKGADRLQHKESNRALSLRDEFGKMGVAIDWHADMLLVTGGQGVKGALVHSHHDHRIAMACAVAALGAAGDTILEEAQAIDKSYPSFFEDLRSLGAVVNQPEIVNNRS